MVRPSLRAVPWIVTAVLTAGPMAGEGVAQDAGTAAALVGSDAWPDYFPFRLGDSWTYDWKTDGPMASSGTAVRTRSFDGTSFVGDLVGYKLVSDDGSYHLYTFDHGVLAIHSSLENGRYFDYEPPLVVAAPDLRPGEPRAAADATAGRRWTTTIVGLTGVEVPLGRFERVLEVRIDMQGADYASRATHYFARGAGLIAYRYQLMPAASDRPLLTVDARLRLARLGGTSVSSIADLSRVPVRRASPSEDRSLREALRSAIDRRYTWDAGFTGFQGDVVLAETGKPPIEGSFVVGADLSVRVEAADAAARTALRNEVSSFVTHRKPAEFDRTYAETTFVKQLTRPDGSVVVVAAGDPLATTYVIKDGEVLEMGRSMGRVSYLAREREKLRAEDGRTITVAYDVVYSSNENAATLYTEHTRDSYVRLGSYWVPQARRVEKQQPGAPASTRELVLSNLRVP